MLADLLHIMLQQEEQEQGGHPPVLPPSWSGPGWVVEEEEAAVQEATGMMLAPRPGWEAAGFDGLLAEQQQQEGEEGQWV